MKEHIFFSEKCVLRVKPACWRADYGSRLGVTSHTMFARDGGARALVAALAACVLLGIVVVQHKHDAPGNTTLLEAPTPTQFAMHLRSNGEYACVCLFASI